MRVMPLFASFCVFLAVLSMDLELCAGEQKTAASVPTTVRVEAVSTLSRTEPKTFIGVVTANNTINVVARVSGTLEEVAFREGALVRRGDLLFAIEDDTYQANLAMAKAVARQMLAEHDLAQKEHDRRSELLKERVIASANFDEALHTLELHEARLEEAMARVTLAERDMDYTRIHAAATGRIGKSRIGQGNMITPESGILATIQCFDPAYVEFAVGEAEYSVYFKDHDTLGKAAIELVRANGETYAGDVRLDMVDNAVDERTNTIMVRLTCENADLRLLPGGYVQVRLARLFDNPIPAVPAQAVMTDGKKYYVFVVGPEDLVERREIEVGETVFRNQLVPAGLQAGERVIVGGMNKTWPGDKVKPVMEEF